MGGTPFKAAAEEYTMSSASITRMLRGIPGWYEHDYSYMTRNRPHIEAMKKPLHRID